MRLPTFPESSDLQTTHVLSHAHGRVVFSGKFQGRYAAIKVGESVDREARLLRAAAGPGLAECLIETRTITGAPAFASPLYMRTTETLGVETCAGNLRRTLKMIGTIAGALSRLHALGWTHGDISAANVMQTANDDFVLIDLGAARRVGETPSEPIGSFHYMAPEAFDRAPADPRADIFSLAAVAWRMLVGAPPEPFAPSPNVNLPGFVDLLERCLSPDPSRRPPDCRALSTALQELC